MKTSAFSYELPKKYIAQHPPVRRGATRLMVLDRASGFRSHGNYADIPSFIQKDDVVVLNDTKVLKARLFPKIKRSGREIEILLLEQISDEGGVEIWDAIIGGARYVKHGDLLTIGDTEMEVLSRNQDGKTFQIAVADAMDVMEKEGHVPLPPYISRSDIPEDERRYNTIFAQDRDSAAAPTASLNFTEQMMKEIEKKGANMVKVHLAVGLGTFAPVDTEEVEEYAIHTEYVSVDKEAASVINACRGRIWAFGTTVVRALETAAVSEGKIQPFAGKTDLYIFPGYEFKIVDVLVTNFHMPGTSLIMLVSAFAGREHILEAYEIAKKNKYAFLSYGDSMLIGDFESNPD